MNTADWIAHSDSFFYQIFMLVMGALYALAFIIGVTYKTMNIYCYFILYPATFALFLKSPKKYWVLPATMLFFVIPGIENKSAVFFDSCVDFLNYSAKIAHSNYIDMSVYLCVIVPVLLYIPLVIWRSDLKTLKITGIVVLVVALLYFVIIYPNFKPALEYIVKLYPSSATV
jgi:hypothetical protein